MFLGCLTEAVVTDNDHYGVNIKRLIEGLCEYIVDGTGNPLDGEEITLDMLCRDLQRMIIEEARASPATKGKVLDFHAPFSLFDEDGSGHITPKEFQNMLVRLQLIDLLPEGKMPAIIAKFDPKNKGYITADDFKSFVESLGYVPAEDDADDNSDYDEEDYGLSSNTPPVTVTRTAELDWLAWFLFREACKVDGDDPESVITELSAACAESEIIENAGAITKTELWTLLYELKLKGNLTKKQYEDSIKHLAFDRNDDTKDDLVDYESLCRYVIRMGRAFHAMVQEKKTEHEKMYQNLKSALLNEMRGMVSVGAR